MNFFEILKKLLGLDKINGQEDHFDEEDEFDDEDGDFTSELN